MKYFFVGYLMRRTNTEFLEGFVSGFFIQPVAFTYRTTHNQPLAIGSVEQDWQQLGKEFLKVSKQVVATLDKQQQYQLYQTQYVPKTT